MLAWGSGHHVSVFMARGISAWRRMPRGAKSGCGCRTLPLWTLRRTPTLTHRPPRMRKNARGQKGHLPLPALVLALPCPLRCSCQDVGRGSAPRGTLPGKYAAGSCCHLGRRSPRSRPSPSQTRGCPPSRCPRVRSPPRPPPCRPETTRASQLQPLTLRASEYAGSGCGSCPGADGVIDGTGDASRAPSYTSRRRLLLPCCHHHSTSHACAHVRDPPTHRPTNPQYISSPATKNYGTWRVYSI